MVTIKELAKLSGYSTTMISRVINNYPYVDEEKRREILKLVDELNYRPNSIARNLSIGKTYNIGVIVPSLNRPYFEQIVSGITEEAFHHNYKVTLLPTNYDRKIELGYLEELSTKLYDGLIITSKINSLKKILDYQQYGPLIFCEYVPNEGVASVSIDREKAFMDTMAYFFDHNVKKIGMTTGRNERYSDSTKLLLKLAKKNFKTFDQSDVVRNCRTYEDGYRAGKFFYEENQVEAILTNGDEVSAGIYDFYRGKKLPLIVGQDNLLASKLLNLSTIDYHLTKCGREAFLQFINNRKDKIMIESTFIER
ncbi:LacI family DNA-binding transcriptional regulator [Enterococcus hulanensis]|uniref:LacI family DNA-binding transcriptional regulator n=1 Tax=Enterococcus hulanensis TaxID=2559929 RepID=A0ABU3F0A5_9ENTE|nr:LacI family DNA-binding transcriptional regulator [Enterococcus hulanensis]MDT2600332.1 LacI family DNA-binding transcriptional regulator [Enterococcus hulanensis]MDT2609145.1 LacI family DNA-binding transcriptional regulator [Enterococcus hulanensis]MDT2616813.1 LacI family DNA-binding transcriptional regulator [Enterococcus hulanensis]MDT2628667.1 LacI family DNA-binding transcriptional regulator [Enterococcus hulanensis]MDT2656007.1 LacI family DNA-binding transcriptional regulator [Ente